MMKLLHLELVFTVKPVVNKLTLVLQSSEEMLTKPSHFLEAQLLQLDSMLVN